jgi:hypothetical protein
MQKNMIKITYSLLICSIVCVNCSNKSETVSDRFANLPDSLAWKLADSIAVNTFYSIPKKDFGFPSGEIGKTKNKTKKFSDESGNLKLCVVYFSKDEAMSFKYFTYYKNQLISVKIQNYLDDGKWPRGIWLFRNGKLLKSYAENSTLKASDLVNEGNEYLHENN